MRRLTGFNRLLSYAIGFIVALDLSGCASNLPAAVESGPEIMVRTDPPKLDIKQDEHYASQFGLMALFAKTVYRRDILNVKARSEKSCEYLGDPGHRDVMLNMPRDANGSHWARWTLPGTCYQEGGLFFETYIHTNASGRIDEAVIAIRGTENDLSTEIRQDWSTNFSGIFPWADNEYQRAGTYLKPVISQLAHYRSPLDPSKGIDIYLTGHSLGGGIAQYAAYLFDAQIKETFVFNTSPVTHWMQLPEEAQRRDPKIHRISMNGEVLSYVREVTSRFNSRRFNRTDYEFHFVKEGAVKTHDMSHLTCQFAARISDGSGNNHHYSRASADATLNSPILCPNDVRAHIPQHFLVNRGITGDYSDRAAMAKPSP